MSGSAAPSAAEVPAGSSGLHQKSGPSRDPATIYCRHPSTAHWPTYPVTRLAPPGSGVFSVRQSGCDGCGSNATYQPPLRRSPATMSAQRHRGTAGRDLIDLKRPAFLFQGDPALGQSTNASSPLLFKHRHHIRRTGKHIAVGQAAAVLRHRWLPHPVN